MLVTDTEAMREFERVLIGSGHQAYGEVTRMWSLPAEAVA